MRRSPLNGKVAMFAHGRAGLRNREDPCFPNIGGCWIRPWGAALRVPEQPSASADEPERSVHVDSYSWLCERARVARFVSLKLAEPNPNEQPSDSA